MTLEKLIDFLAKKLDRQPDDITAETTFESLNVDSLSTVELVMDLEDEAGIEIDLDEKVVTVGDLYRFIQKKNGQAC